MLLELNIKDFAIIDTLHLSLHRLFNVFTGETGAGKSIIIDAVSALLGGKIGADFVRPGCDRADRREEAYLVEPAPEPRLDARHRSFHTLSAVMVAEGNSTNR